MNVVLDEHTAVWQVTRWSGRSSDHVRNVYVGNDETRAVDTYVKAVNTIRQGSVQLYCDSRLVRSCSAPNLRTRW